MKLNKNMLSYVCALALTSGFSSSCNHKDEISSNLKKEFIYDSKNNLDSASNTRSFSEENFYNSSRNKPSSYDLRSNDTYLQSSSPNVTTKKNYGNNIISLDNSITINVDSSSPRSQIIVDSHNTYSSNNSSPLYVVHE